MIDRILELPIWKTEEDYDVEDPIEIEAAKKITNNNYKIIEIMDKIFKRREKLWKTFLEIY